MPAPGPTGRGARTDRPRRKPRARQGAAPRRQAPGRGLAKQTPAGAAAAQREKLMKRTGVSTPLPTPTRQQANPEPRRVRLQVGRPGGEWGRALETSCDQRPAASRPIPAVAHARPPAHRTGHNLAAPATDACSPGAARVKQNSAHGTQGLTAGQSQAGRKNSPRTRLTSVVILTSHLGTVAPRANDRGRPSRREGLSPTGATAKMAGRAA